MEPSVLLFWEEFDGVHVFFMILMSRTTFSCGGEYVTCGVMSIFD